jgi:nucleoside 2-deoxyribosyltransferase
LTDGKELEKIAKEKPAKTRVKVLVLLPFPANEQVKAVVVQTLSELDISPLFVGTDSKKTEEFFSAYVPRVIELADLIIADLTDFNPNVVYEVGYAHGMRKRVLLILRQGISEVPWTIHGFLYIVYDYAHLDQLRIGIRNWIAHNSPIEPGELELLDFEIEEK